MDKLRRYRGGILGLAIRALILPTYTVLAYPLAETTPDFSWAKDLPPLLFLVLSAVVIIALLVYLFTRVFPKQEPKITMQSVNGAPAKEVTVGEMLRSHVRACRGE